MKQLNSLSSLIFGVLFTVMISISSAQAAEQQTEIQWILTGSSTLDRSTKFLSNGYTDAGIRYANKVLARADKTPLEAIIAQHNLCIANSMKEGMMGTAACQMARQLPMPEVALKQVKEGLYKVVKRSKNKGLFANLITQNLAIVNNTNMAQLEQLKELSHTN